MFPCVTRKGDQKFFMVLKVKENLVVAVEDGQTIEINF
jgi:hypothetical protein